MLPLSLNWFLNHILSRLSIVNKQKKEIKKNPKILPRKCFLVLFFFQIIFNCLIRKYWIGVTRVWTASCSLWLCQSHWIYKRAKGSYLSFSSGEINIHNIYLQMTSVFFCGSSCYKNSHPKPTYSEALTSEKIMFFCRSKGLKICIKQWKVFVTNFIWYHFCDESFYHEEILKQSILNELEIVPLCCFCKRAELTW